MKNNVIKTVQLLRSNGVIDQNNLLRGLVLLRFQLVQVLVVVDQVATGVLCRADAPLNLHRRGARQP